MRRAARAAATGAARRALARLALTASLPAALAVPSLAGCGGGGHGSAAGSRGRMGPPPGVLVPHGSSVRSWRLSPGRRVAFGDYDADELQGGVVDRDDDDSAGAVDVDGDRDSASAIGGGGGSASAIGGGGGRGSASAAYLDADDRGAEIPDRAARGRDAEIIAGVVRRYFAAGVSADGRKACALMLPGLARAVPHDPGVLPYARAKTCAQTMSKFFRVNRQQLATEARALSGVHGRVAGNRGWALLSFRGIATRAFAVGRYRDGWRMAVTIADQDLP